MANNVEPKGFQEKMEVNIWALVIVMAVALSVGGIVEIVPLFMLDSTMEHNKHPEIVWQRKDAQSLKDWKAGDSESMYDHPFQWGSKRTGPDLARLGGKYSDGWHRKHLRAPRSVVPESVMPNYPWLAETMVDASDIKTRMSVMRMMGVPYNDADMEAAPAELEGKTEEDAMVAYLQVLGTMAKLDESKVYRE
jgi:cytochrome c oxidase cbb3-type subunit 2